MNQLFDKQIYVLNREQQTVELIKQDLEKLDFDNEKKFYKTIEKFSKLSQLPIPENTPQLDFDFQIKSTEMNQVLQNFCSLNLGIQSKNIRVENFQTQEDTGQTLVYLHETTNHVTCINLSSELVEIRTIQDFNEGWPKDTCICYLPNHTVFITGGSRQFNTACKEVWAYNPLNNEVGKVTDMNGARYHHSAVQHNEEIYIIGGFDQKRANQEICEKYVVSEDKWKLIASLDPAPGGSITACCLQEVIYVLGGFLSQSADTVQCYHVQKDQWEVITVQLPKATGFLGSAKINNHQFIFFNRFLDQTYVFDSDNNKVQRHGEQTKARYFKDEGIVLGNVLHIFDWSGRKWSYHISLGKWQQKFIKGGRFRSGLSDFGSERPDLSYPVTPGDTPYKSEKLKALNYSIKSDLKGLYRTPESSIWEGEYQDF